MYYLSTGQEKKLKKINHQNLVLAHFGSSLAHCAGRRPEKLPDFAQFWPKIDQRPTEYRQLGHSSGIIRALKPARLLQNSLGDA